MHLLCLRVEEYCFLTPYAFSYFALIITFPNCFMIVKLWLKAMCEIYI